MKAAFSIWENRIATVFDCARTLLIVRAENGNKLNDSRMSLDGIHLVQRALAISDMGIGTVVCGAISREFQMMLAAKQIAVVPFVSGDISEVVSAWIDGTLEDGRFLMPGCYRYDHGFMPGHMLRQLTEQGFSNADVAAGTEGFCVCPSCGTRLLYERATPCWTMVCPSCGTQMLKDTQRELKGV